MAAELVQQVEAYALRLLAQAEADLQSGSDPKDRAFCPRDHVAILAALTKLASLKGKTDDGTRGSAARKFGAAFATPNASGGGANGAGGHGKRRRGAKPTSAGTDADDDLAV